MGAEPERMTPLTCATITQQARVNPKYPHSPLNGSVHAAYDLVMLEQQRTDQEELRIPRYPRKGWIGVDLDGTLARADATMPPEHIGPAVPQMLKRVRYWIKTGRTVKVFTARAGDPHEEWLIHQWCKRHGLPRLEITNSKDHQMIALWDDRAVGVVRNLGVPLMPVPLGWWQLLRLRLSRLLGGRHLLQHESRWMDSRY